MTMEMKSSSAPLLRNKGLLVLLLLFVSALLLVVLYLQYNFPGKWWSSNDSLNLNGEALTLVKGSGYSGQGKLVIDGLAEQGVAVASLSPPVFQAEGFSTVRWSISGVTPDVEMEFIWRTADNPDRVFMRPLARAGDSVAPLQMTEDDNWRGQIIGLALAARGRLAAPISVEGVSLHSISAQVELGNLFRSWFSPEEWEGTSINFLDRGAIAQKVPLALAVAALVLLSLAIYWVLARFKVFPGNAAMVWAVIFLGWFMLDARWQWNLGLQLDKTRQQFSGKSWEDKHRAAEDGALFEFMRQVKAKLPSTPGRVLYFSDDVYLQGRGAYHLYPHNVFSSKDLPPAGQFRSGDYVVLFAKKGVKYNPSLKSLMWGDGQSSMQADLLMFVAGNAFFRVR